VADWDDDDRLTSRYVAEGDSEALETLYRRHVAGTYGFARRFMESREDAEEATSECWLRTFRALRAGQYRGTSSFKTWVYGICRNVCYERLRQPRLPMLSFADLELPGRNGDLLFEHRPDAPTDLEDALASLTDDHRLILTLCDLQGFTAAEAASIIGRSTAATKSLHLRARRALRDALMDGR
jgi:RNA polymerase sigma-70 factor (ECF subfamily)